MGTLYLVRHGQASFGAQDYDQLSALGLQQSVRLGQYWRDKGLTFNTVLTGTLRRQAQTWAGIAEGARYGNQVLEWTGLNEFDSAALIATVHSEPLEKPDTPELYRHHFRLLRDGLTQWMKGATSPQGMPSYREFQHGVVSALDHIRAHCEGNVLIVSSGGPIATALGHVLGTAPETNIELNMRLRNSAVTEFAFNPKRHTLLSYNTLAHLDSTEYSSWITYA
jgi:broad specificity phosphatase PhoE